MYVQTVARLLWHIGNMGFPEFIQHIMKYCAIIISILLLLGILNICVMTVYNDRPSRGISNFYSVDVFNLLCYQAREGTFLAHMCKTQIR